MSTDQASSDLAAKRSKVGRSNVKTAKVHERRAATLLTEWSGVKFRRRRVEGRDGAVRVVELVADVIPCAGDFHYAIECKKGKGFSLDALMASPHTSLFTTWWHQACYDAQLVSGDLKRTVYPMMFFKPHPNWDWIAFSAHSVKFLRPLTNPDHETTCGRVWFPHLFFDAFSWCGDVNGDISHTKTKKMVKLALDPVIMCRWRDFEMNVCPKSTFLNYPEVAAAGE